MAYNIHIVLGDDWTEDENPLEHDVNLKYHYFRDENC